MIPQRQLSLLANRLARLGGRRIPDAVLERDYCLAWFLVGLSRSPLRQQLVFKGGTALKRCYFGDYRFSEDLDFTLAGGLALDSIVNGLEPVYAEVRRDSGIAFRYSRGDRDVHANSHTFYIAYEGPLPAGAPKEVKVDITIRERVVRVPVLRPVLQGYPEYADLREQDTVLVYRLEEIAAEKIVALTDRARNEPRDLYDLWYLLTERHVNLADLVPDVQSKLAFRGRDPAAMGAEFRNKERRYERLWEARLGTQMAVLPEFEAVFRRVRREMRTAGFA